MCRSLPYIPSVVMKSSMHMVDTTAPSPTRVAFVSSGSMAQLKLLLGVSPSCGLKHGEQRLRTRILPCIIILWCDERSQDADTYAQVNARRPLLNGIKRVHNSHLLTRYTFLQYELPSSKRYSPLCVLGPLDRRPDSPIYTTSSLSCRIRLYRGRLRSS